MSELTTEELIWRVLEWTFDQVEETSVNPPRAVQDAYWELHKRLFVPEDVDE